MVSLREQDVSLFIPHRATMQMLTRVVARDGDETVGELEIKADNPFCFDGTIAAVTGIEWMAQVVAAHGGVTAWREGREAEVGFLLGTPKCSCAVGFFRPGQHLRIRARKTWGDDELLQFHCTLSLVDDDTPLLTADLNVYRPRDLGTYLNGEGDA